MVLWTAWSCIMLSQMTLLMKCFWNQPFSTGRPTNTVRWLFELSLTRAYKDSWTRSLRGSPMDGQTRESFIVARAIHLSRPTANFA
ncbi:hypothetical protein EDB84DRAFT_1474739 [Lactarius hengduanensis]|nr:hypothetical protein EDB84DRAFT_1474739 [Lactarius hengduanensis]